MAKKMEKLVANYRVIIEQDKYADGSVVFSAYCPTLELADYGDTVEEALKHMKGLIKFHLESLTQEGIEIPQADQLSNSS